MRSDAVRHSRTWAAILGIALLAAWTVAPSAQFKTKIDPKTVQICSDILARLSVQRGADGTVTLTGKVCNQGPGAYNNPQAALDAYFMVYGCHPPKTYAQESDLTTYAHTDLGTTLKANDCRSIQYAYKIGSFSRWGTFPSSATERQAMKQFCVQVQKKGTIGFSKCEDSTIENTTSCVEIPYMEKIK